MAKARLPNRRQRARRQQPYGRRKSDVWKSLGKLAGLVGSVCAAILGQAELVGEPWRHVISVTAITSVAVWGYCVGPQNVQMVIKAFRR